MNLERALRVAKTDAVLAAQKALVERYAATFLLPAEAAQFAQQTAEAVSKTNGLLCGVSIAHITVSEDGTSCEAVVEAHADELRRTLGRGKRPAVVLTAPIVFPGDTVRGMRLRPQPRK